MRRVAGILACAVLLSGATKVWPADKAAVTYYVQLVRGSDEEQPPVPGSRRVGPRLTDKFQTVFKWRNYWEVAQREAVVAPGSLTRVRLNAEREVQIDLSDPRQRKVTAFHKGTVVDRIVSPTGEAMTLIGANRDGKSAWFVVVRRDKPRP